MHSNQLDINDLPKKKNLDIYGKEVAVSLREYKPKVSEFKITHKASMGGVSRTTKSPKEKQKIVRTSIRLSIHMADHDSMQLA